MIKPIHYVLGFMFNEDLDRVLLIEKQKPEWQNGKINGIGGKIEIGESPLDAMSREMFEEADIENDKWELVLTLYFPDSIIHVFAGIGKIDEAKQVTIEKIIIKSIPFVEHDKCISNLKYLIPMSLQKLLDIKNGKPNSY